MPPDWRFLLDRGVNFRTKRELLAVSFAAVYQLADVGLTGLAEIRRKPPDFRHGDESRAAVGGDCALLPVLCRSGRIEWYGTADNTQELQVQTQAHSSTGADA
jgi:hypothetical protein